MSYIFLLVTSGLNGFPAQSQARLTNMWMRSLEFTVYSSITMEQYAAWVPELP